MKIYNTKLFIFLIIFWMISPIEFATASTRHALVIGNSDYGSGFDLINPRTDSTAIAFTLSSLGYQVYGGQSQLDLPLEEFNSTIDDFLAAIEDGSNTLIYYAGHGAASSGSNYLIPILPVDVILKSEADIRDRSISLESILERVNTRNPTGVNALFFDACRDAPVDNFSRSINLTSIAALDTAKQPRGSFVGFSTEYGNIALDDDDDSGYSPFASAILNSLDVAASAPIELFYKNVVDHVYDATEGQQFPIFESKIRGRHCIIECDESRIRNNPNNFGTLSVNTIPIDATVCYLIEGWNKSNCGPQVVLPLNQDVQITVTAKGYKPFKTTTRLNDVRQQIRVELEKGSSKMLKIIGGVAAILITGVLLSGDSGGSSANTSNPQTITILRP